MSERIDALQAQQLVRAGAQLVDALPTSIYVQEHLPGAISLPLETLTADKARDALDPYKPVVVYCFDQHCDLSSRSARRYDELGFTEVYDLVGGRAAWTVLGLPTEGEVGDRRRISQFVDPVVTVSIGSTIGDLPAYAREQSDPVAVVSDDDVLLGSLLPPAFVLPPDTPVERAMVPAPGTIRPDLRVEDVIHQFEKDHLDHVYVTAVSGELIGLAKRDNLHV